ncbi:hypothetical protein ISG25_33675, partial [Burkholderia pseudomallei]|nr:hypothetical protein [Burkholderia pseudomallei]MBF3850686.1 hypothetical protein [Burkholderia pseudomallei]
MKVAAAVGLVKARPMRANAGQCGPMRDRRARLPSLATREAPAVRAGGFESRRDAEIAWRSCRRRRLAPCRARRRAPNRPAARGPCVLASQVVFAIHHPAGNLMQIGQRLGTPLSPSATRVMLLGAGELGKEVII